MSSVKDGLPEVDYTDCNNRVVEDVMIGVEVFEDSDIDTDNNRLQFYSDTDVPDSGLSDPSRTAAQVTSQESSSKYALESASNNKSAKKRKKNSKPSREPSRLSLEDRIKCIRICSRYDTYADAQKAWKPKYGTEPPCRKTLSMINKKFQRTGSVADLKRTGRPKCTRTEEGVTLVEDAVRQDPSKSIRTIAKELGINHSSVFRIKKTFEEKKNTLKIENKKLKDSLNDALKRIVLLERRLTKFLNEGKESTQGGIETMLITSSPEDTEISNGQLNEHANIATPTIIALNSCNGQISLPTVLRLQQTTGSETIHIITLPQGSSPHLLSLDESPLQIAIGNEQDGNINFNQMQSCTVLPSTSSSNPTLKL